MALDTPLVWLPRKYWRSPIPHRMPCRIFRLRLHQRQLIVNGLRLGPGTETPRCGHGRAAPQVA